MTKKNERRRDRASSLMKKSGYKQGGAVKNEGKKKEHEHKKHAEKLKDGGYVQGGTPKKRLDKPSRKGQADARKELARGGKASKGTTVNVIVAGKDGAGAPGGMPPRPPMPPMGAKPPMAPPGGGMPPGAGGPPPQMAKRGGAIKNSKYPISAGSGGGEGRLQKAAASKKHKGGSKNSS